MDDSSKQNKALLEIAKVLNGIKVLTEAQWETREDKFTAQKIKKGLKSAPVSKGEVKKALQKMHG